MSALGFAEDIEAMRRVVTQAPLEKRLKVFQMYASENIRWVDIGKLDKLDVVDRIREIGIQAELSEEDVQAALSKAVDNPFEPPEIRTNGEAKGTLGKPFVDPASLVVRRAAEIEPEPITWLWEKRIALGKQTIFAGEPGLGKSQLTCWITAAVTTGGAWPGNEGAAPTGSAIILSAEDDAADTIRPRLDAAGADVHRVYIVSAVKEKGGTGRRAFNLQADLQLLENEINRIGDVRLVVIDPVSSYLGKVDSHRNAELRAVLEPVGEMAARLGVCVISVTHLNKSSAGGANSRFIGSIAFVAAARAAFVVCRDPEDRDRRLFLPTKNNLGPEGGGIGFRVGTVVTESSIVAPTVFWDTMPVTMSADEALNTSTEYGSAPARNEAEDFLREVLAGGPLPTRRVESEAKAAGLSWRTVRRAKDMLGVKASKSALDGGWVWTLPEDGQS